MGSLDVDESSQSHGNITMPLLYGSKISAGLDLRVFYLRLSNFEVDDSIPDSLTLNYIPLTPDNILELNGRRSNEYLECASVVLRRDRFDKRSEEVTFVSTDSIRIIGSVQFEVYDRIDLLLSGVLELSSGDGLVGEAKHHSRKWSLNCGSVMPASKGFLKAKYMSSMMALPLIEVYITGSYSGSPIILTKTIQVGLPKKHQMKPLLKSIPEYETSEMEKEDQAEAPQYQVYKENDMDVDYHRMYCGMNYPEGEDEELSWFNAGVRVGVGIGLGVCLGVGVGVGLLVRTFQATTRNFKRKLI